MDARYTRHQLIDWWDQERLSAARVMVAGAGAVGNEVIKLLALVGIGQILIVDFDLIEISNLTRSVLFHEEDIGKRKAQVAAERAWEINPEIQVRYLDADLEYDVGLGVYRSMDVVIGCLDSVGARLALNRACCRTGVGWLNGGIEAVIAEVALYDGGEGPCFECAMSQEMWDDYHQRFSCTGLLTGFPEDKVPTTATVASIAAGYLVNEVLFLLHAAAGKEKAGLAFGQKLYLTFKPYGWHVIDLPRSSQCLAHERWEPIAILPCNPDELTAAGLLQAAGLPEGQLELGFDLLTRMRCVGCGQTDTILQPVERCKAELSQCPHCHSATRQPETVTWLDMHSEFADCTLAQLGIPDYQILAVKSEQGRHYIQLTGPFRWNAKE